MTYFPDCTEWARRAGYHCGEVSEFSQYAGMKDMFERQSNPYYLALAWWIFARDGLLEWSDDRAVACAENLLAKYGDRVSEQVKNHVKIDPDESRMSKRDWMIQWALQISGVCSEDEQSEVCDEMKRFIPEPDFSVSMGSN